MNKEITWPNDADGDVLRHLNNKGFDFSLKYKIEFDIDFNSWPPTDEARDLVHGYFGNINIIDPDEESPGSYSCFITDYLTYELIIKVQRDITKILSPHDGFCNAWGVLMKNNNGPEYI